MNKHCTHSEQCVPFKSGLILFILTHLVDVAGYIKSPDTSN